MYAATLLSSMFLLVTVIFPAESKAIPPDLRLRDSVLIPYQIGSEIVQNLKSTLDSASRTSYRKEQKAIIPEASLALILQTLRQGTQDLPPIELVQREKNKDSSEIRGTFTFYGRAIQFKNSNANNPRTTIRLRARSYLSYSPDLSEAHRSEVTLDRSFLEIKIRNPVPSEPQGVHKYRIVLPDEAILRLFQNPRKNPEEFPEDPEFHAMLVEIAEIAIAMGDRNNTPNKVYEVFRTIESLSKINPEFTRPIFATSYVRDSYSYTDSDGSEFQFTFDKKVKGYIPSIRPDDRVLPIEHILSPDFKGITVEYPQGSIVVEMKEPSGLSKLRASRRSTSQTLLYQTFLDTMRQDILPGFIFNRGKAGHISRMLDQVVPQPYF